MFRRAALTILIIAATAAAYIALLNAVAHIPSVTVIPALALGMWAVFHTSATALGKVR